MDTFTTLHLKIWNVHPQLWKICLQGPPPSSSAFPAKSLGFTIFGEIFAYTTVFFNQRGSHIPSLGTVQTGCVYVASIHPSRTCQDLWSCAMESMRAQTIPRFILHLKEFQGMKQELMLTPREKSPLSQAHRRSPTCSVVGLLGVAALRCLVVVAALTLGAATIAVFVPPTEVVLKTCNISFCFSICAVSSYRHWHFDNH